ncbi:MAG: ABC transporter permease [Gemmatimonadota bacterium]
MRAAARTSAVPPGRRAVLALLVTGFIACTVLAASMIRGEFAEIPTEAGRWALELGGDVEPGDLALEGQIRSMRRVASATAALVALLALLSLVSLLRQDARLRRDGDRVHWALGASRSHFAARAVGEGWPTAVLAGTGSLTAGLGLPVALALSFPGRAELPEALFLTSLLLVVFGAMLLHRARGVGRRAAGPGEGALLRFLSLPVTVGAVGFAVLVTVGLLREHVAGPSGPDIIPAGAAMATADLRGLSSQRRGDLLEVWAADTRGSVGLASTRTVRGAGRRATVWVDCGRCSVGGLPLPVRTVRAEIHAVAPDTFARLALEPVRGRDFRTTDSGPRVTVAVVSQAMAIRHFQDGQAVGRRIRFGPTDWIEVIGVVPDRPGVRNGSEFAVYLPLFQARPEVVEVVEGVGSGAALPRAVAAAPGAVEVGGPVPVAATFATGRWFEGLLGAAPRHLHRHFAGFVVRQCGAALALGGWMALALGAEVERAFGTPPILDGGIWLMAAIPIVASFLLGATPPFLAARRGVIVPGPRSG